MTKVTLRPDITTAFPTVTGCASPVLKVSCSESLSPSFPIRCSSGTPGISWWLVDSAVDDGCNNYKWTSHWDGEWKRLWRMHIVIKQGWKLGRQGSSKILQDGWLFRTLHCCPCFYNIHAGWICCWNLLTRSSYNLWEDLLVCAAGWQSFSVVGCAIVLLHLAKNRWLRSVQFRYRKIFCLYWPFTKLDAKNC